MLRFSIVVVLTACGLNETGTLEAVDGAADVVAQDVVIADVVSEPGPPLPCSTDASACTSSVAPWAPVAYAPSRAVGCPANFTSLDVVTAPQVQAGACTCNCTPGTAPSCAIGTLTGKAGATSACGDTNNSFVITTEGQCYDWGGPYPLALNHEWDKLPLTAGTCTSTATLDSNKVSVTGARVCQPPPECKEDVCGGTTPAGFASCIATTGDVACPTSGPFTKRAVIAASIQFGCSTCSACTNTGTGCGTATVDYYAGQTCTTSLATDTVSGTCTASNTGVSGITHIKYTAAVQSPACTAGTSVVAPTPTNVETVCCR